MLIRRFKVERSFPVTWKKEEAKVGEIFELVALDIWHEVGGGFHLKDSLLTGKPDFSGGRLRFLLKEHYIEEL